MNILIIDNYDSFTFNLYQYIGEILTQDYQQAFTITVKRNNEINLEQAQALQPDRIIISPGPGSPDDPAYFGVCAQVIKEMGTTIPLLGVCLGMQGIAHVFGGRVVRAPIAMHGKTSAIVHDGSGVFSDLPQGLDIMRYHSLMADANELPDCLQVTSVVAQTQQQQSYTKPSYEELTALSKSGSEIMAIKHKQYPIQGVQFHPESFATEGAKTLIANFLFN